MLEKIRSYLDLQKPYALGFKEWDKWHEKTKSARPVAYFLSETLPGFCKDVSEIITDPIHKTRYWIRTRTVDKYHVIKTGLAPGYQDAGTRILHGNFSLLVDYVEVELAWMNVVFDKEKFKKVPWWSKGWLRFKSFRNKELGLDHLRWEMTLDSPSVPASDRNPVQAARAKEVWELYHWWKHIRPTRPDPHDASGWSEWCESKPFSDLLDDEKTPEEQTKVRNMINRSREIEEKYSQEDEDMLIRLIKIRESLWT
jgi:hypothetical protein